MNKKKALTILPYLLIPLLIIFSATIFANNQKKDKLEYFEIVSLFDENKVAEYTLNLSSGELQYTLRGEEEPNEYTVPNVNLFLEDVHSTVIEHNRDNPKKLVEAKYISGQTGAWLLNILPTVLMVVLMGAFLAFMFRRMNQTMTNESNRALGFGKARVKQAKDEKRKTTFDDVAGADEEKEELAEIVAFLKEPAKFNSLGARIPKGVLLVGPPGTGKTLLARATAGEASVPFFSISGSDFVEMYVGVGASRVRDLFDQAKKNAPSIIFIDEIDAVGRHRGAGMGGGHDEREQTLNQLLVEMDGFGVNEGVIILAATNRPDILDPALLRPGRFDRQVAVGYPDIIGREAILRVHAKGKPLGPDVDLSVIARSTVSFTGADLENLLNEAALLAARSDKKAITMEEIEEATIKVLVGGEKKSRKMSDKEKRLTAYHEAGHAVVTFFLEGQDPVHQVSIIPRGLAGGYTLHIPTEDKNYSSKSDMLNDLVVLLGGRVAEHIAIGDISTGASNDIERATKIARDMVTRFGMSDKIGPVAFASDSDQVFLGRDYGSTRNYSEEVASAIDEEVQTFITDAYDKTMEILTRNRDKLEKVAQKLLEVEKIDAEQFKELMQEEAEE
ncbi:MAG: ATP-dependent zinc metalloprotease FtsH [Clostridiales bacterium]|nr:ATP-dependent zinc metalloprotease FtsH [Clostridiales bacterium]